MAGPFYVDSAATGSATGADWTNAFTTIGAGIAAASAGEYVLVASTHSETPSGSNTWTPLTTSDTNPVKVVSVDKADDSYLAGATVTGASACDITFDDGVAYFGITIDQLTNGDDLNYSKSGSIYFEDCTLSQGGGNTEFSINGVAGCISLKNCSVNFPRFGFAAIGTEGGHLEVVGGSLGASAVCAVEVSGTAEGATANIDSVDMSGASSMTNVVNLSSTPRCGAVSVSNCKLPASYSGNLINAATVVGLFEVFVSATDEATGDITRMQYKTANGDCYNSTSVYRSGDYSGENYSLQLISGASVNHASPARTPKIFVPITEAASKTLTVELVLDSATALRDDECWIEVQSLDTSEVGADYSVTRGDIYSNGATLTASSVSWTGTGGFSNEQKRKIATTISFANIGVAVVRVYLTRASTTLYICPQVDIS